MWPLLTYQPRFAQQPEDKTLGKKIQDEVKAMHDRRDADTPPTAADMKPIEEILETIQKLGQITNPKED